VTFVVENKGCMFILDSKEKDGQAHVTSQLSLSTDLS
jgi:hypothetical protein